MELKRINRRSALFFGAVALVFYLIIGIFQLLATSRIPELQAQFGAANPLQSLVVAPLVGAVVTYLFMIIVIIVYNLVAQKYPISWKVTR